MTSAKIKTLTKSRVGDTIEKRVLSYTVRTNINEDNHFENFFGRVY